MQTVRLALGGGFDERPPRRLPARPSGLVVPFPGTNRRNPLAAADLSAAPAAPAPAPAAPVATGSVIPS